MSSNDCTSTQQYLTPRDAESELSVTANSTQASAPLITSTSCVEGVVVLSAPSKANDPENIIAFRVDCCTDSPGTLVVESPETVSWAEDTSDGRMKILTALRYQLSNNDLVEAPVIEEEQIRLEQHLLAEGSTSTTASTGGRATTYLMVPFNARKAVENLNWALNDVYKKYDISIFEQDPELQVKVTSEDRTWTFDPLVTLTFTQVKIFGQKQEEDE